MIPPFSLGKEEEIAFSASLCTHPFEVNGEIKTVLPQGAQLRLLLLIFYVTSWIVGYMVWQSVLKLPILICR